MNLAALVARRKDDLSYQRAQGLSGRTSVLVVGKSLRELLDPLAVESMRDTIKFCDPAHHTSGLLCAAEIEYSTAYRPCIKPDEEVWISQ